MNTTYPIDTYLVVRTIVDGESITDQPIEDRIESVWPPLNQSRYQYPEALAAARQIRGGGDWAIVLASQDITEEG